MGLHNLGVKLRDVLLDLPFQALGSAQGRFLGAGAAVPTSGMAPGALFIDYDAAGGSRVLVNNGSLATPNFQSIGNTASDGTSAETFTLDSDAATGKFKLSIGAAGTNHTVTLKASPTTQNVTITLPDFATGTVALLTNAQSLDAKTLTACAGLTLAAAANILTTAGGATTSYLSLLGKTSGGIKVLPPDTGTSSLTLSMEAQTQACTAKVPDLNVATMQFVCANSDHTVTVNANGSDRTISLSGNLTTGGAVTFSGAFAAQFTVPDASTWTLPAGGGTLATATGAETGTTSSSFTVDSDSGNVKMTLDPSGATGIGAILKLVPANLTAATTRTWTFPDASDTVAGLAATQTFAAKTLTAPVINGATTAAAANNFDLSTGTGTFKTPTGDFTHYGNVTLNGAGLTFDFSASAGTFKTPTGTNTLGGNTVIADGKYLQIGSAAGGVANSVRAFSATAGKGEIRLHQPDDANNKITTLQANNAAANAVITVPNATTTLPGLSLANTFTAAQAATSDDTTDGVVNLLTLTHSSSDNNATALDGVGIAFHLENATGTSLVEEWGSLDVLSTTITNGSEDADAVLSLMLNGVVTEALRLDGSDQSLTLGQNATDADGIDKLRVYGLTQTKGGVYMQAVANTDDNVWVIVKNAAHATASRTYTFGDAGADKYIAYTSTAAGTVARADITQETAGYTINMTDMRVWNACASFLPSAAAADDMGLITGTFGTDPLLLQGIDFKAATTDERCRFSFVLPVEYVAGGAITVRVRAGMNTTISDGTATVDVECYVNDEDGTVTADLCSTAAQSINDLVAADKDFTITPAGRVAGEQMDIVLTFGGTDGATGTAVIPQINKVSVRLAVKG